MTVVEQHTLPEHVVVPVADLMASFHLDVWLYRGTEWYVPDPKGPHVDREAWTVKFDAQGDARASTGSPTTWSSSWA